MFRLSRPSTPSPAVARSARGRFVAGIAGSFVALGIGPLAVTLVASFVGRDVAAGDPAAATLVLAMLATVVAGASALPGFLGLAAAAGAGVALAAALLVLGGSATVLAIPLVGVVAVAVGARLAARLYPPQPTPATAAPPSLDHSQQILRQARGEQALRALAGEPSGSRQRPVIRSRRWVAVTWAALSVLGVLQTARLATYVLDPSTDFVVATRHPFWFGHQCLPAYLYGAELAGRGEENLYHASHYPGLDAAAAPTSALAGLKVDDPYQYPPQFLLLPAAALALTDDVDLLRTGWFALQLALFAGAFLGLSRWVGGRLGGLIASSAPLVMLAFPVTYNFQFGQFHLAAVSLAVLAMLAFARGRRPLGGALLAGAVLSKLFPGVLVVYLAAQRRWRELGWTALAGAALTVAALVVLGPAPFVAFTDYHLPRLATGEAFGFDLAWPELAELVVTDNQGAFGLARKLGFDRSAAAWVGRGFGLAVLAAAIWAGWRQRTAGRWARGAAWLALLGLASLASAGAWGDYVPSTAVWLLALLAPLVPGRRGWRWLIAVSIPFQGFLLGTFPFTETTPVRALIPVSLVGSVLLIALFGAVVLHLASLADGVVGMRLGGHASGEAAAREASEGGPVTRAA